MPAEAVRTTSRTLAFVGVAAGTLLPLLVPLGPGWVIFASWGCALAGFALALLLRELRVGAALGIATLVALVTLVVWALSLRLEAGATVGAAGIARSSAKAAEFLAMFSAPIAGVLLVLVAGPRRARRFLAFALAVAAAMTAWAISGVGAALEGAIVLGFGIALVLHVLALRASFADPEPVALPA